MQADNPIANRPLWEVEYVRWNKEGEMRLVTARLSAPSRGHAIRVAVAPSERGNVVGARQVR